MNHCSPTPVRPWPVNPIAPSCRGSPEEPLVRRPPCMMVESGGALVEASRVPCAAKFEHVVVKVMAELMAERTQKRSI